MNPLRWIETMARETEQLESLASGGKPVVPIRLNGTNMSLKSPMFQKESEKRQFSTPSAPSDAARDGLEHVGQAKRAPLVSETDGNSDSKESAKDAPWDVSFLHETSLPTTLVQQIQSLATQAESAGSITGAVKSSYRRIRDHVSFEFGKITSQGSTDPNHPGTAMLLDDLCKNTIQKMKALIVMVESETAEDQVVAEATPPPSKAAAGPRSTVSKKQFAEYMSAWLRQNWTNPYPDEDGLVEMAAACDTTSTVVGNWLINARTRKWRPAIVKAFEMGRPADLLLEDSLNVFDGQPLRDLAPGENTEFYPAAKRTKRN